MKPSLSAARQCPQARRDAGSRTLAAFFGSCAAQGYARPGLVSEELMLANTVVLEISGTHFAPLATVRLELCARCP